MEILSENGFEVPYIGAAGNTKFTLSNAGFSLSNTQIPLNNLNFGDYLPAGGTSPSPFTPSPSLDGYSIPGGSSTDAYTPEPSFTLIVGAGVIALLAFSRRQANASR